MACIDSLMKYKKEYDETKLYAISCRSLPYDVGELQTLSAHNLNIDLLIELACKKPIKCDSAKKIMQGIISIHNDGFTSIVYEYIAPDRTKYAIKVKRSVIETKSFDLFASFDNELLRRIDFLKLELKGIAKTLYASSKYNFIVSEWVEGVYIKHMSKISRSFISEALQLVLRLETHGFFDFDMNMTNIIYSQCGQPYIFDFGCIYRFDPRKECNPYGVKDTFFDGLERYKNTHMMRYLTRLERNGQNETAFDIYVVFVKVFKEVQKQKLNYLNALGADSWLLQRSHDCWKWYESCDVLEDFTTRFVVDKYLSYVSTLEESQYYGIFDERYFSRVFELFHIMENDFNCLCNSNMMFEDDKALNKKSLIEKYRDRYLERINLTNSSEEGY